MGMPRIGISRRATCGSFSGPEVFRSKFVAVFSHFGVPAAALLVAIAVSVGISCTVHATPPTPGCIAATDGVYADRVHITWCAVPGATSYQVWRAVPWLRYRFYYLGTTTDCFFDDTNAPCGTNWYRVRACNGTGCSLYTPDVPGSLGFPGAAAGVHASDGTDPDAIHVTWDSANGAASYEVYRAAAADGPDVLVGQATQAEYDDASAPVCETYWYKVRACNACGCGAKSASDSGWRKCPLPPLVVSATDGTLCNQVRVTWNPIAQATEYVVYRASLLGGPYLPVAHVVSPPYDDLAVGCQSYWYGVQACSGVGCSPLSNIDEGWPACAPPTPSRVQASDGEYCNMVRVTWDSVAGAKLYQVSRAATQGGTYQTLGKTATSPFDDPGASGGWYRVTAENDCGASVPSTADRGFGCVCWASDFETDDGWTFTGLWHLTTRDSESRSHSLWFGNEETGTYGWNASSALSVSPKRSPGVIGKALGAVSGFATSPTIPVTPGTAPTLSFSHHRWVESYSGGFDKTYVQVRYDSKPWTTVWYRDCSNPVDGEPSPANPLGSTWVTVTISLVVPTDVSSIRIRFVFNSEDSAYNDYPGWFIDDVRVNCPTGLAEPKEATTETAAESGWTVQLTPNPVRDVHTAEFSVRGADVDGLRVEIYDLSGTLVFSEDSEAPSIVWHTEDEYGEYLANGVYLYRVWALVDGRWVRWEKVGKLVILR